MGNSRPYKWAQSLCSLDSSRSVTLSDLVSSVSDRWTNMKGLEGTLELLKLYKLHPNFKIPLETGRIKSYKMSTEPVSTVCVHVSLVFLTIGI